MLVPGTTRLVCTCGQRPRGKAQAGLALCVYREFHCPRLPTRTQLTPASTPRCCDWTLSLGLLVAQVAVGSAGGLMTLGAAFAPRLRELVDEHPSILGWMMEACVPLSLPSVQQD